MCYIVAMEKIYNVNEVCQILRLHRNTVLKLLQDGRLKGYKVSPGKNSRWNITETELNHFIGFMRKDSSQFLSP